MLLLKKQESRFSFISHAENLDIFATLYSGRVVVCHPVKWRIKTAPFYLPWEGRVRDRGNSYGPMKEDKGVI